MATRGMGTDWTMWFLEQRGGGIHILHQAHRTPSVGNTGSRGMCSTNEAVLGIFPSSPCHIAMKPTSQWFSTLAFVVAARGHIHLECVLPIECRGVAEKRLRSQRLYS